MNNKLWNDFLNSIVAINCETEDQANDFLNICNENNLKWCSDNEINKPSDYDYSTYYSNTTFTISRNKILGVAFGDIGYWRENNFKIIKYNELNNENIKYELHKRICVDLNEVYKHKNHDYGDSFGETYEKLGIISAVTRITDKVNRLQSLCTKEQKVKDESIKDTLRDLANYSIMTLIEMEENEC